MQDTCHNFSVLLKYEVKYNACRCALGGKSQRATAGGNSNRIRLFPKKYNMGYQKGWVFACFER
jgi:hypothetical protein